MFRVFPHEYRKLVNLTLLLPLNSTILTTLFNSRTWSEGSWTNCLINFDCEFASLWQGAKVRGRTSESNLTMSL